MRGQSITRSRERAQESRALLLTLAHMEVGYSSLTHRNAVGHNCKPFS